MDGMKIQERDVGYNTWVFELTPNMEILVFRNRKFSDRFDLKSNTTFEKAVDDYVSNRL